MAVSCYFMVELNSHEMRDDIYKMTERGRHKRCLRPKQSPNSTSAEHIYGLALCSTSCSIQVKLIRSALAQLFLLPSRTGESTLGRPVHHGPRLSLPSNTSPNGTIEVYSVETQTIIQVIPSPNFGEEGGRIWSHALLVMQRLPPSVGTTLEKQKLGWLSTVMDLTTASDALKAEHRGLQTGKGFPKDESTDINRVVLVDRKDLDIADEFNVRDKSMQSEGVYVIDRSSVKISVRSSLLVMLDAARSKAIRLGHPDM
ncbi:hypothetical protein BDR03DRAFT_1045659 [Suillus americanus]|nr:hypothetical protein BDR03DRAFT_1045659 [Suillus americanus]